MANDDEKRKPYTRHEVNLEPEKKLLTHLITNDEVCDAILPILKLEYLQSEYIAQIILWVKAFWEEHKTAPRKHIKDLFEEQKKKKLKPELAGMISTFLDKLSEEYLDELEGIEKEGIEKPVTSYLIEKINDYLHERALYFILAKAKAFADAGNKKEAEEAIKKYEYVTTKKNRFEELAIDAEEFNKMEFPEQHTYIQPWLTSGTYVIIYGPKGVGKTMYALDVAYSITRNRWEERSIGPWKINNPAKLLYVDGEVGQKKMSIRTRQFQASYGRDGLYEKLVFQFNDQFRKKEKHSINLVEPSIRQELFDYILKNEFDVVVLDNASTLCPGIDENSKTDWDPIIQWILDLKAHNITTILVVHASNKDQTAKFTRGASSKEDPADAMIKVKRPIDYKEGVDKCYVHVFTWCRSAGTNDVTSPFTIRYDVVEEDGVMKMVPVSEISIGRYDEKESKSQNEKYKKQVRNEKIAALSIVGMEGKDIACKFGLTGGAVSNALKKFPMQQFNLIGGGISDKGRQFLDHVMEEYDFDAEEEVKSGEML